MTLSTIENDVDCKSTMALELAKIFNECQTTTMNHRRNCIALKQLQLRPLNQQSANFGGQTKGNRMPNKHARNLHELPTESELCEWEAQFFMEFFKIVGIVLAVKKTDDAVQRIIKFVHAFCIHSNTQSSNADSLAVERGIHARFLENFIQCLLHGVEAKDKMVRHRVCMLLNGCINAVDELRDDLLAIFVTKLAERLFDKEAVVRVAAVQALSRLQEFVVERHRDGTEITISTLYKALLQHDPSIDVRKAVLEIFTFSPEHADIIIERSQDEKSQIRKFFFKTKMEQIDMRNLTIRQRETILKNGLLDRDATVKEACIGMIFHNWLPATGSNIIQFLESLDVVANAKVAQESLNGFFAKFPKLFSIFPESYFESLTVETAFIMRVYCEFVLETQNLQAVQDLLPEVIKFAQYLKASCESFVTLKINSATAEANAQELVSYSENEFILVQLFRIGKLLDFSDEVSRRFMISLLRDVLCVVETPTSFIPDIVAFLFALASSEEERIGLFAEIVVELYEDDGYLAGELACDLSTSIDQLTVKPADEEKGEVAFIQKLKSLWVLFEMLKLHVSLDIPKYQALAVIFNEIVIHSINSSLAAIQEIGLECLGQFCLLHPSLSKEYSSLLVDFFRLGHAEIQVVALRILFDLLLSRENTGDNSTDISVSLDCIKTALCDDANEELQIVAVEGCAKLFLRKTINDQSILEGLALLYFHPSSIHRPKIRQCLCYFFPAFFFSSTANQALFVPLVVPIVRAVVSFQKQTTLHLLDTVTKPLQAGEQIFYWLDPSKAAYSNETVKTTDIYGLVAIEILKFSFNSDSHELIKIMIQLLLRLRIDASCEVIVIKKIDYLASNLLRKTSDKVSCNNLRKFIASFIEFDDRTVALGDAEIEELKAAINN